MAGLNYRLLSILGLLGIADASNICKVLAVAVAVASKNNIFASDDKLLILQY